MLTQFVGLVKNASLKMRGLRSSAETCIHHGSKRIAASQATGSWYVTLIKAFGAAAHGAASGGLLELTKNRFWNEKHILSINETRQRR